MTTYTLSQTSPLNTVLRGHQGNIVYEISTPLGVGHSRTTVKRGGWEVATLQWKTLEKSTITMNGRTAAVKEAFPRSKRLSTSRIWTMPNGYKFKWEGTDKLHCMSIDTGLNIATYERKRLHFLRRRPSTLNIVAGADIELTDAIVVTWAIIEKKARDRRRTRRALEQSASGGGWGY